LGRFPHLEDREAYVEVSRRDEEEGGREGGREGRGTRRREEGREGGRDEGRGGGGVLPLVSHWQG